MSRTVRRSPNANFQRMNAGDKQRPATQFYTVGHRLSYRMAQRNYPQTGNYVIRPAPRPDVSSRSNLPIVDYGYGKESVSKRKPIGSDLRYMIPNYMGFVQGQSFKVGQSYGKSTRECILDLVETL